MSGSLDNSPSVITGVLITTNSKHLFVVVVVVVAVVD